MAGEESLATHALAPGAVFAGDFEIVEALGQGGMGALYVARQRSTGALRALKLMQRELVRSRDLCEKFEREARIGAQIESDHVAAVLASGVDAQTGLPWIAMELLRGETLAARLDRGPLPWPEVVEIFGQMCHALAAAHRRGIVHRDLKPENVFLGAPRMAGVDKMVKLLDFGIAKVVEESGTTLTGVIGTPAYMAPEQYQGRGIGPQTDVWALGLMAFHLVTGRSYWRNAGGSTSGPASLMYEACMEALVPAMVRARELGVERFLPVGFDGWFSRCVARDPRDRYPSAAEALTMMRAVGSGSPLAQAGVQPTLTQAIPDLPPATVRSLEPPSSPSRPSGVSGSFATQEMVTPSRSLVPPYSPVSAKPSAPRRGLALWIGIGAVALTIAGTLAGLALSAKDAGDADVTPVPSSRPRVTITADPVPPPRAPGPNESPHAPSPPSGRSPLPTVADWNVVGEVTVTGSSALGCETKMIREWLRITCKGTDDTGGTPTEVATVRGGGAETFTFAKNGVTSLLLPFVEGVAVEAIFAWTDKRAKLTVSWPRGTPMPASKGQFTPH
jgi:serine/threonine protein kinase